MKKSHKKIIAVTNLQIQTSHNKSEILKNKL